MDYNVQDVGKSSNAVIKLGSDVWHKLLREFLLRVVPCIACGWSFFFFPFLFLFSSSPQMSAISQYTLSLHDTWVNFATY